MNKPMMFKEHLGGAAAIDAEQLAATNTGSGFKTFFTRRVARLILVLPMLLPMAGLSIAHAANDASAAAIDELPLPQEVIENANDARWRETIQHLQANLPPPAPQPDAWLNFLPGRQVDCAPQQMIAVAGKNIPCGLLKIIVKAADETGTDAVYLMALADKESSFRKDAKAPTSSARGLFQFLDGTWLELVREFGSRHGLAAEAAAIAPRARGLAIVNRALVQRIMDLRENPYVAAVMAAEMAKRDQARVAQNVGRNLDRSEYYFTHFLGAGSATRLLRATDVRPATSATGLFPKAARANRSLFTRKVGRKQLGITVGEFRERVANMMLQRFDHYQEVEQTIVAQDQVLR